MAGENWPIISRFTMYNYGPLSRDTSRIISLGMVIFSMALTSYLWVISVMYTSDIIFSMLYHGCRDFCGTYKLQEFHGSGGVACVCE